MKKSGIIAGFMLAAVLILAGCENLVGDGKSPTAATATVTTPAELKAALDNTNITHINVTAGFEYDAIEVTRDLTLTINTGQILEVDSLTVTAALTLNGTAPAALSVNRAAGMSLAIVAVDRFGILKIKTAFEVTPGAAVTLGATAKLAFAATGSTATVDGVLNIPTPDAIYVAADDTGTATALALTGSGTVTVTETNTTIDLGNDETITAPPKEEYVGPTYTITGALSHTTEYIGGKTFSFSDFSSVKISLKAFGETTYTTTAYSSDSKIVNNIIAAGEDVGTVNISGSGYTISGVPAGTYRLTAEDPTGLYDFVDNEVEVGGDTTKDIALAVFPGLKLTVRMPKTFISYYAEYGGKFTLPVRSGKSIDKTTTQENMTINLDVDWGDGTASKLTTAPDGNEDPDYTHSYADALGDSDEKEFVVRVTGTCISEFVKGGGGTDVGKFAMGHDPDRSGAPGGKYAGWTYGMWHYGNMDKMIKAAGNITALTGDLTDTRYTYLFLKCRELKDISGLVFTETNPGDLFLSRAFEQCTALTAIPAGLLPHATSVGLGFLSEAFKGSGLAAIPDGFLPSYTTVGNSFLKGAFGGVNAGDGTDIREIPVGFIPASLTEVGNYFLANTFYGCKELTTIPAGFASPIKKIGSYFLDSTFGGCDKLTSIPPNFLPQSPSTIADHFLASTFTMSGITSIPVDLIPEGYKSITTTGTHFLFQSFINNQNINTVDLSFLQNINVSNSSFLNKFVSGCANLTEAYIPYISFNGNTSPFSNAFQNPGSPINLYISGGGTSNVLLVNNSAGLTDAKVTAIYLDNADLVTAYKGSSNWSAISDSKFHVRP